MRKLCLALIATIALSGCGIDWDEVIDAMDDLEGTPTATPAPGATPTPAPEVTLPSSPVLVGKLIDVYPVGLIVQPAGYPDIDHAGSMSVAYAKFYSCDTGQVLIICPREGWVMNSTVPSQPDWPYQESGEVKGNANGNWVSVGYQPPGSKHPSCGHTYTTKSFGDGSRRGQAVLQFQQPGPWQVWFAWKATENRNKRVVVILTVYEAPHRVSYIYDLNQYANPSKLSEALLMDGKPVLFM